MGGILSHWRIITAAFFSCALIVSAYLLTRSISSPSLAEASTESALLQAIATKDSDGDSLFDWEEALYGADPRTVDTFGLGMSDGEAVAKGLIVPKAITDIPTATSLPSTGAIVDPSLPPAPAEGTLTAAFAQNFFTLYLSAKQANGDTDLPENDIMSIMNEAVGSLSSAITVAPDFKSASDLIISGSGADALKTFAASAETVFLKNTVEATKSELEYLQEAVENDNPEALSLLADKARAYRNMAVGLSVLPVPQELATNELALINSMMRMSEIATDFTRVNDDPLAAMLALQQYVPAGQALGEALANIGGIYATESMALSNGTPGASFISDAVAIAQRWQEVHAP